MQPYHRLLLFSLMCGSTLSTSVAQQNGTEILRVEEDWELVLREPDPWLDSPQLSTWMSPVSDLDTFHFGADWNHAQRPDFSAGGFQTKAFQGDTLVREALSETGDNLTSNGETVRWTQAMLLHQGSLIFLILSGHGSSWGSFGGPATAVSLENTSLANLNAYSPLQSAEWSGVGFGGNRVQSLKLLRVRYFLLSGEVIQTELDIDVHQP